MSSDNISNIRRIFVHGLICQTHIGIYPHEKIRASRVRIDIDAFMDDTPHRDSIDNTACYADLARIARDTASYARINLAETLAERIAAACFDQTPISRICVRVCKPDAFHDAEAVGVEISRDRPRG